MNPWHCVVLLSWASLRVRGGRGRGRFLSSLLKNSAAWGIQQLQRPVRSDLRKAPEWQRLIFFPMANCA